MKTIWFVNFYAYPPEYDTHKRHFEFARNLQKYGYKVHVFCSAYLQGENKYIVPDGCSYIDKDYSGVRYTLVRVPSFVGNGLRRMVSIYQFARRLVKLREKWEKPDIVYLNEHAPFDYPIVKLAKKLQARFIIEAWDLWPYDFVTFGLIKATNPALKVAYRIERKMYEAATDIVYTFQGGIDYLRMQRWTNESKSGRIDPTHVHYINNGLSLSEFYQNVRQYPSDDKDLNSKDSSK